MNRDRKQLFEQDNMWKIIFSLALPSMFSMVIMILYNITDMFFISRTGDLAQIASISLVIPVYTILMSIGAMMGGGGCILTAQSLGDGDRDSVRLYSSLCFWGSLLAGIVYLVVVILGRSILLDVLGTNEETRVHAMKYMTVISLGAPAMLLSNALGRLTSGEGAIKIGVTGNFIGTVINMILDPLFILVLNMGVGGAALATVTGNLFALGYILNYILRGSSSLSTALSDALKKPKDFLLIIKIGFPSATSNLLSGFSATVTNRFLISYGTAAVAAMSAANKSTMVINMIQMGICLGVQPLIAYLIGKNDIGRLNECIKKLSVLTISVGLLFVAVCMANSRALISIFLKDKDALELGTRFISIIIFGGPFIGIVQICTSFLQAAGASIRAATVSMLRKGLVYLPLLLLFGKLYGLMGRPAASIASDMVSAAVGLVLALRCYKKITLENVL